MASGVDGGSLCYVLPFARVNSEGADNMPARDPAKAVQMLGMMLEFFGEYGHRWITGGLFHNDYGGRCLVSAMAHLRAVNNLHGDPTRKYLKRALPDPAQTLNDFNDDCRCFDEVRQVIERARRFALADARQQQPQITARELVPDRTDRRER